MLLGILTLSSCDTPEGNSDKILDDNDKKIPESIETPDEFLTIGQAYVDRLLAMDESFMFYGKDFTVPEVGTVLTKAELESTYVGYFTNDQIYESNGLEDLQLVWNNINWMISNLPDMVEGEYIEYEEHDNEEDVTHAAMFRVQGNSIYFEYYQGLQSIDPTIKPFSSHGYMVSMYEIDGIVNWETRSIMYVKERDYNHDKTDEQLETITTGYSHVTELGLVNSYSLIEKYNLEVERYSYRNPETKQMVRYLLHDDYSNFYAFDPQKNVYIEQSYDGSDNLQSEYYEFRDNFEIMFSLHLIHHNDPEPDNYKYEYNLAYIDGWDECVFAERTYTQRINNIYNLDFKLNNQTIDVEDEDLINYRFQEYASLEQYVLDDQLTQSTMELGWTDLSFTRVPYADLLELINTTDIDYFLDLKDQYSVAVVSTELPLEFNTDYTYYINE